MIRCSHEHDCGFGGRMIFILNGQLVVVNLELVNLSLVGSFLLVYASWWLYFCFRQMGQVGANTSALNQSLAKLVGLDVLTKMEGEGRCEGSVSKSI